jgi:hypothetical protein
MMNNDILLDLRRDLIRINRAIRKELARPRPDLLRIIDLRRLENACTDRLAKTMAAMRAAQRRRRARRGGTLALRGVTT